MDWLLIKSANYILPNPVLPYYFAGVTDNQATLHEFVLLLERKTKGCQDEAEDVAASYPSLLAITARHGLINPMDRLIFNGAFSRLA